MTAYFYANKYTRFYVNSSTDARDPEDSYSRVSRNTFFSKVKAGAQPNVSRNVQWTWMKNAQGQRYRHLKSIRVTRSIAG